MKKIVFTLALVSLAVISCFKKEAEAEQLQTESNVMLEEPKTTQESAVAGTPEEEGKNW